MWNIYKTKKNGPGKFMVQTYVNWCMNQRILSNNLQHQPKQESPFGMMGAKSVQAIKPHDLKSSPDHKIPSNYSFPLLSTQANTKYDTANKADINSFRGPGYSQEQGNARPNFQEDERAAYTRSSRLINNIFQEPVRSEHDPRQSDFYNHYVNDEYRMQPTTNSSSNVGSNSLYVNGIPLDYSDGNRAKISMLMDYGNNNFTEPLQQARQLFSDQPIGQSIVINQDSISGEFSSLPLYNSLGLNEREYSVTEPGSKIFIDKTSFIPKNTGFVPNQSPYLSEKTQGLLPIKQNDTYNGDPTLPAEPLNPRLNGFGGFNALLDHKAQNNTFDNNIPSDVAYNSVFSKPNLTKRSDLYDDSNNGGFMFKTTIERPQLESDRHKELGVSVSTAKEHSSALYLNGMPLKHQPNPHYYKPSINIGKQSSFVLKPVSTKRVVSHNRKQPVTISAKRKSSSKSFFKSSMGSFSKSLSNTSNLISNSPNIQDEFTFEGDIKKHNTLKYSQNKNEHARLLNSR